MPPPIQSLELLYAVAFFLVTVLQLRAYPAVRNADPTTQCGPHRRIRESMRLVPMPVQALFLLAASAFWPIVLPLRVSLSNYPWWWPRRTCCDPTRPGWPPARPEAG